MENAPYYWISYNLFASNNATNGGGLHLENVEYVNMTSNTFIGNNASYFGGGLNFNCSSDTFNCKVLINGDHYFTNNTAWNAGGAIKWSDIEPTFE